MAYMDENGIVHSVENSFFSRVSEMFSDTNGILLVLLPLIVLIGIFFSIKHYSKNKKLLIIYSVVAIILYIFWFFMLTKMYMRA